MGDRNQPALSLPRDRDRRQPDVLRVPAPARPSGRRVPRVRAGEGRDPDDRARPLSLRGRGAGHPAARERARRRAGRGRVALEVGAAVVVGGGVVQAGRRRTENAPARHRTGGHRHAGPAHLGRAAVHDAAAVLDQPGDEDRHHFAEPLGDGLVDARLLDHPRTPARRARGGQRGDLGRAAEDAAGGGRSRPAGRLRRHARRSVGGGVRRAGCGPVALLRRRAHRHRRLHRNRQPAPGGAAHVGGPDARNAGPGADRDQERQAAAAGRGGAHRLRAAGNDRRRRHQRRPRVDADRREIPLGQHARGDARRGSGARRHEARLARGRDRHQDIPSGDLHRGLDRQPVECAADRLPAGGAGDDRVPLRVARRLDRQPGDPAVAARRRPAASIERCVVEHHGARGLRDRHRRGGRRRHHRHREHHAPPAPGARCIWHAVGRTHHSRGLAGGAPADRLRHPDRRHGRRARALPGGAVRRLLQAPGVGLRAGDPGLDARRGHGDAGARPDPAAQRPAGWQGFAAGGVAVAALFVAAGQDHRQPAHRLRRGGAGYRVRCCAVAAARAFAAAGFQGTRLPDALGDQARHLASRDGSHHHPRQQGVAGDPRRAQLWRPHRPGLRRRRGGGCQLRRELDQHLARSRLRQDDRRRQRDGQRLPRAVPRLADVPEGTHARGADGFGRGHRRAHLRPRP